MGNEAVVIPIVIDPKSGIAGLQQLGGEAQKASSQLGGINSAGEKFGNSMKGAAANVMSLVSAMNIQNFVVKAVIDGFTDLILGTNQLASSTKMLTDIQDKAESSTRAEVATLQNLYAIAKDVTLPYEQRRAAIDKLNQAYPQLHENMKLETIGNKETAAAIQNVVDNMVKKAQLSGIIAQLAELQNELSNLEKQSFLKEFSLTAPVIQERIEKTTKAINDLKQEAFKVQAGIITMDTDVIQAEEERRKKAEQLRDKAARDWERHVKETISKAKAAANELKGIAIVPTWSAMDSQDEAYKKATKFLGDLSTGNLKIRIPVSPEIIIPPEEAKGSGLEFAEMFSKEMENYFKQTEPFDASLAMAPDKWEKDKKKLEELEATYMRISDLVSNALTPAFTGFFDAIFENQDPLKAFFDAMANSVKQLIKQLVQAAIQAAVLSLITGGASNAAKGGKSFIQAFTGIMGFAEGGMVTGPVLSWQGEGRGTNAYNPEIIAPLDKLRKLIGFDANGRTMDSNVMGTSGMLITMPNSVELKAKAGELYALLQLEIKKQNRVG